MSNSEIENGNVERLSASHRSIYTDIIIDASADRVWSVLADTGSFSDWAVFMIDIKGKIKDGETISVTFKINPEKEKLNKVDHKISVIEGKEFFWAEKGPGGIRDNHHFKVEPLGNGKTKFIQSDEIMKGITWLAGGNLSKMYLKGYQEFNRALKAEVERRNNS